MSGEKIRAFGDALTSIIKAIKFKCSCKCCESNCNEPNSPNSPNVSLSRNADSQKIFDYAQRGEVTNL